MKKISIEIDELKFDIRTNTNTDLVPIFIFLHGFKSFRNWGFIPYLCEQIANRGFISINLDFSKNGIISEYPIKFDVDIFSENTISQEIMDVDKLLSILFNSNNWDTDLKGALINWNGEIILAGHSRGAGIAIITATKYLVVRKLVLMATISDFNRYTNRLIEKWINDGNFEFNDPVSGQRLNLKSSYILDIKHNQDKFNLKKIMQKLDIPILILHGDNDLSTPLTEGKNLYENYKKNIKNKHNHCNFVTINRANHLFNCNHPFNNSNKYLDEAIHNIHKFLAI